MFPHQKKNSLTYIGCSWWTMRICDVFKNADHVLVTNLCTVLRFYSPSLSRSTFLHLFPSLWWWVKSDKQPAGEGIYSDMEFPKGLVGEPGFGRPSVWPFKPQNWHVAVPKVGFRGSLWTHLSASAFLLCDWQATYQIGFLRLPLRQICIPI